MDYSAFVIEVHVRRSHDGTMACHRGLQDATDVAVTTSLRSGGMEEGAWALLTEAVRTEVMLQLLVKMTKDAEFHEKTLIDPDAEEQLKVALAETTMELMDRELRGIIPGVVRDTIKVLRDGLRTQVG